MTALSVAETLRKAADLIEPEGAWTQGEYARDCFGFKWSNVDDDAYFPDFPASCFCIHGAIAKVQGFADPSAHSSVEKLASKAVAAVIGTSDIAHWNDASERTQAEVVAALRAAADASEAP